MSLENLDKIIIESREEIYHNERENCFVKMCKKHFEKQCNCIKNKKQCNMNGIIDLSRFNDEEYIHSLYKSGVIDSIYNIMQSVTQSLKTTTGKHFENIIESQFITAGIQYNKQIKLPTKNNHTIDFAIPPLITENYNNYIGTIISCKTSLRERHLQDKFLNSDNVKVVTITMDKETKIDKNIINVDSNKKTFTIWLNNLKNNNKMEESKNNKIKVLDLFCGCGGFTQGFKQNSNFDIVAGIDIWDTAINTYKNNHSHLALCKNIVEYTPDMLDKEHNIKKGDIDCIIGGPPCQGFSNAGKRDQTDPRNSLFMEYVKFLDYYQPFTFIMENVMGILSMLNNNKEKCIDIITGILSKNYNIIVTKLYASDFNVPQNRRRVLIFGIRKDFNIFPTSPKPLYDIKNRPTVGNILEKKEDIPLTFYLSDKALEGIRKKKEKMKSEGKGFGAQYLDFNKPSYTIPARYWKDGYDALVHYPKYMDIDESTRRLTLLELSRIQTFPDNYKFSGSKKDIIIQIGNAVACNFAYQMSIHIKNIFNDISINNDTTVNDTTVNDTTVNDTILLKYTIKQLKDICRKNNIKGFSGKTKIPLIEFMIKNNCLTI